MAYGLFMSLEQEQAEALQAEYADTDVTDIVETSELETELVERAEEGSEIEERDTQLDIAEDAAEAMESLIETLSIVQQQGGLDRNGAAMLNHARANIYARFGLSYPKEKWISVESFGDVSSRQTATTLALEEEQSKFKQVIRQIWEAIKSFSKKIVDFIQSWVTATGRTKRRAEAIKAKAPEASFTSELEEKHQKKFGKYFVVDGQVKSVMEATNLLAGATNNMKDEQWADKMAEIIQNIKDGIDPSQTEKKGAWQKFKEWCARVLPAIFRRGGGKDIAVMFDPKVRPNDKIKTMWNKGDGDYFSGDVLPGGRALCFFHGVKEDSGEGEEASSLPVLIVDFAPVEKVNEEAVYSADLLPKNSGDVVNVCDKVISICEERERVNASLKKFAEKANNATNEVEKKVESLKEQVQNVGRQIAAFFRNLFNSVTKPFAALAKYCVTISKYALDVCIVAMKGSAEGDDTGGSEGEGAGETS